MRYFDGHMPCSFPCGMVASPTHKRVAIIGAGPAGLTAAYQLSKSGFAVRVFEAGSSVGGLAKTIDLWNQKVDLGPHRFFSSDSRVNKLWLEVIGSDYDTIDRLTRIYYQGNFFYYPLRPFDVLPKLGVKELARCFLSFMKGRFAREAGEDSFEDWVVARFGRRLFEIFFKTYSEKLWGISCRDLDSDFAAQRIKKFSLLEAVKSAFTKTNKHKTLVDQFAYPHGGTGELYNRMAEFVQSHRGTVQCNRPVRKVLTLDGAVNGIEFEDGEKAAFDHVISTMPLNQLVMRMPAVPESLVREVKKLRFRNTILVYLKIEAIDLFKDNWLYVHSPELRMGRITNFRNWTPHLYGKESASILALEYWSNADEQLWQLDDAELVNMATSELRQTGLAGDAPVSAGYVCRIPRCYPIYDRGYKNILRPIERYLNTIKGLAVIGRYGSFKYNNQDHSILMGLLAAENVTGRRSHNLWDINTDYEEYQESSRFSTAGLAPAHPAPVQPTAAVLQEA